MPAGHGLRSRTRGLFSRPFRHKGYIHLTTYLRNPRIGDYVDRIANSPIHKGIPENLYKGRSGTVWNISNPVVADVVNKQVNGKINCKPILVHAELVQPSRCPEEFLKRIQRNNELKAEAIANGHSVKPGNGWSGTFPKGWRCFSTGRRTPIAQDLLAVMERRMASLEGRHAYLNQVLSQPAATPDEVAKINKELSRMEDCISCISLLKAKRQEMEGLKSLLNESSEDDEMHRMATDEMRLANNDELELQHDLLFHMLPKDEADSRGCILEVRAGTGGEEASLFAMDIFKMYERYSQKNSWRFEVLDVTETDLRGYKEASASITGTDVFGRLKFESGVHRVQRVPVTEKQGRVHTSAASVAVLPQADEVDVNIRNDDLRIDTYRSGGAGGQHTNTTNSAVRVTHLPTGTVVAIQDERSQGQNKAKALKILRAKLFERERSRQNAMRSELRQDQIGSGDRSERIRTYNFPQGRVTDHRVGITQHSIEHILQGEGIDNFIDALELKQETDALASLRIGLE